jgi:RNA polymerase primary sigma factor
MGENDLGLYLKEVARAPQVSDAEETELWQVIQRGGPEAKRARDRIIEANLSRSVAVAKKYIDRGLPLSDLIHASNIGLIRAAERFDHRRDVRFSSYAIWWMRQEIVRTLELAREP